MDLVPPRGYALRVRILTVCDVLVSSCTFWVNRKADAQCVPLHCGVTTGSRTARKGCLRLLYAVECRGIARTILFCGKRPPPPKGGLHCCNFRWTEREKLASRSLRQKSACHRLLKTVSIREFVNRIETTPNGRAIQLRVHFLSIA